MGRLARRETARRTRCCPRADRHLLQLCRASRAGRPADRALRRHRRPRAGDRRHRLRLRHLRRLRQDRSGDRLEEACRHGRRRGARLEAALGKTESEGKEAGQESGARSCPAKRITAIGRKRRRASVCRRNGGGRADRVAIASCVLRLRSGRGRFMSGITHRKMPCAIPPRPGRPGQSLFGISPFGFTREERVNGSGPKDSRMKMQRSVTARVCTASPATAGRRKSRGSVRPARPAARRPSGRRRR